MKHKTLIFYLVLALTLVLLLALTGTAAAQDPTPPIDPARCAQLEDPEANLTDEQVAALKAACEGPELQALATVASSVAPLSSGGPDAFGYTFIDSNAAGGPTYNFEDISSTGTVLALADDQMSPALGLGFSFNYYGVDNTQMYVSSNGFLTVLPGQYNGCCWGDPLPRSDNQNGVIAGWWEDLNPGTGGSIHYQTLGSAPNRRFIVQFTNVPHYSNSNPVTFQFKLFEASNDIEVHYLAAPSDGGQHSAGIENQDGTIGLQYYLGTGSLATPLAVRYSDYQRTYTLDADFDEGTLVNVNHDDVHDQLQLDGEATPFEFIWVAASLRGTIVKIDTVTGAILGEYLSAPEPMQKNPSRTTVDGNGNVWAGNRDEASGNQGSVVHIGLEENGQCVDRNGNGVIDTSTGLGDIRHWRNMSGVDTDGGVETAEDECIIHYVRTAGTNVRTVAVTNDGTNDVWFGGLTNRVHQRHNSDGTTDGLPFNYGSGGYGGLVDGNNVLWSASAGSTLLRYDPTTSTHLLAPTLFSYGLARDSSGNVWNTQWTFNHVRKFNPAGALIASYSTHGNASRGIAATADDNMWIANSNSNTVTRLSNSGVLLATIPVGSTPTGVAVDAAGKVWVTNYSSHNVMRIAPATNAVDLTVNLNYPGMSYPAYPYNYSDMTGSTLIAPPDTGTWTVVYDSGIYGAKWREVNWNAMEQGDSAITVKVASSADGSTFGPEVAVSNGSDPYVDNGVAGRYLKVIVRFSRATTGESPILYDLTIATNRPPEIAADAAAVTVDEGQTAQNTGTVSDADGDTVTLTASVGTVTNNGDDTWSWSFDTADGPAESQTVFIYATDGYGYVVMVEFDLTVNNVAPTIDAINAPLDPVNINDQPVSVEVVFSDPGIPDTHEVSWNWGDSTSEAQSDATSPASADHSYAEVGVYTVTVTVTDNDGGSTSQTYEYIIVYDPDAGFVTGGGWIDSPAGAYYPAPLPFFEGSYYELVSVSGMPWDDANGAATAAVLEGCEYPHLVTITSQEEQDALYGFFDGALQGKWYGGYQNEGETDPVAGWNWVTGEPWDYTNWAVGEPNDGYGPGSEQHLIGWSDGWAWNDEGNLNYVTGYVIEYDGCLTGKANFGFVSKYQKRATVPTGNTEFQFHAADLNFHSDSYDWLLVTGSDYARYKGVGTINGEGAYKFMLWAGDGTGTEGADTFRIRIWTEDEMTTEETVIYDNGMDQDIAGGNIVVHTK